MSDVVDRIRGELLSWPGVTEAPHRFGGVEFRVGLRELGHLHGSRLADLPFPKRVRDELVAADVKTHPTGVRQDVVRLGEARGPDDVSAAIELFRRNYERLRDK